VGLLGILKAGGAYLPIDPDYPEERIRYMIEDSGVQIIVTNIVGAHGVAGDGLQDVRYVMFDDPAIVQQPETNPDILTRPENLAYVIYTSGSTGRPKGVQVLQRGLINHAQTLARAYTIGPDDRVLQFITLSFDASGEEIYPALISGATLVLISSAAELVGGRLVHFCIDHDIHVLHLAASIWHQSVDDLAAEEQLDIPLRVLLVGGERPDIVRLRDWTRRLQRPMRFINAYGPTEATITAAKYELLCDEETVASLERIPIGRPIANVAIYILDEAMQPVPIGVPGELFIGGAGVARGYHRRPVLTAEKFVPDPFKSVNDASAFGAVVSQPDSQSGGGKPEKTREAPSHLRHPHSISTPVTGPRLYRSGDLARWTPDGDLQYLGRGDHQIKIRGYRVELGEIAAVLGEHPAVQAAVVKPWGDPVRTEDIRLAAYLVLAGETPPEIDALRAWLVDRLPAYMIPAALVTLPELPLTTQGKIDRRALPEPDWGQVAPSGAGRRPETDVERALAAIWQALLGVDDAGMEDDFFALGGHSLLVIRLLARVEDRFGIRIPVREFFDAPTLAALAEKIDDQRLRIKEKSIAETLPNQSLIINQQSLLSPAQQRLWLLHQLDSDSPVYHIPAAMRLCGLLDSVRLEAALNRIIARHASLRTIFEDRDGQPRQRILPELHIRLETRDAVGLDDALAQARDLARTPFDLTRGPLIRFAAWQLGENDHLLAIVLHHIIADGWSMNVFLQELQTLYLDPDARLPDLPIQYPDYAAWQQQRLGPDALQPHLDFWRERLADALPAIQLPTDRPRPPVKGAPGAVYRFSISREIVAGMETLAREAGATSFMAFLGAFAALLARYAGQDDLIIGTATANRPRPELEALIGYFVNTLPLRLHPDLHAAFPDLLARTRETVLDAFAHQETPFEAIVEAVRPPRDLSRTPIFQVMFSLQENPMQALQLPDLRLQPLPLDTGSARYDLTLVLTQNGEGLEGWLEYSTQLWDEASIADMMRAYRTLLANIVAAPTRALAVQPLLTPDEARSLTRAWNSPAAPIPDLTIPELFAQQLAAAPDAIAAEEDARWLTYAELDARANQLAHALLARGLQPEEPVAVIMEPGLDWLTALLGILKAGGAYLPIDPAYPEERIRYMLEDAGAELVVSNQPEWESQTFDVSRLAFYVLRIADEEVFSQPTTPPAPSIHPENAAYLIYTSGTTGRPKGVIVPHRAVVRLVKNADYLQIQPGQRVAQAANPAFDATTFEVWGPLLNRGVIVFIPKDILLNPNALADFLARERISALFLTTALFNLVASQRPDAFATLDALLFGGQAVAPHWVWAVLDAGPPERLLHVYGPTETTTFATWHEVTDVAEGATTVPIGLPIAHTACHVVDEAMQPAPPGVVGELFIGGPGLARGYLLRPALTAERFVPDPFAQFDADERGSKIKPDEIRENRPDPRHPQAIPTFVIGQRLYRTGDLVRRRPDGAIEFIGRADRQIKLRGFRIEPGEIEHALQEHPAVEDALVRAVTLPGRSDPLLAAYLIPRESVAAKALRDHLARRLPDYMIPAAYLILDAFPLTPNGKVDETALPLPDQAPAADGAFEPPRTSLEQTIADVWAELLGCTQVGRNEDFFVLGGHSLLAAQAIARINQALDVQLSLRTLFEAPTPAALAAIIQEQRLAINEKDDPQSLIIDQQIYSPIQAFSRPRDSHPVQTPLSFAQQRLWFLQQLEPDSSFYNISIALELRGPLNLPALEAALNHIIARHESLRTVFPLENDGPVARILPELWVDIPLYEAQDLDAARAFAELLARQPFRLSRAPLLRAQCYRLYQEHHVLAFSLHHIIADGWSLGVMIRELAEFYRMELEDADPQVPELDIQYADFAVWQRKRLQSDGLEADLAYWRERLAGLPPALDIPSDYARPPVQTYRGDHITFALDADLTAGLRRLARQHDATLFMVALAAFQALLHRYAGQDDLAVGAAIANRNHPQLEPLIGFFVNTLVMRADFSDDPTVSSLIHRTREAALEAFAHQDAPFDEVVEALRPPRDLSRNPLVQTLFVFQNAFNRLPALPGLDWRYLDIEPGSVKFDLTLSLAEMDDEITGVFGYATDIFRPTTIRRFIEHYRALLRAMVAGPEASVSRLSLAAPGELEQTLAWASGPTDGDQAETRVSSCASSFCSVVELFQSQARAAPDAIAVAAPLNHAPALTYGQLHARTNQLAHALIASGVQPGDIIGVYLPRSPEAIIAILGILKAGAAYLPLDPSLPEERLHFILQDAGAKLVISDQYSVISIQSGVGGQRPEDQTLDVGHWTLDNLTFDVLRITHHTSRITDEEVTSQSATSLATLIDPESPAYVIYTSGTTGRPKGVVIPHRALSNYILAARDTFDLTAEDRVLQFASLAFDAAVEEILATLVSGGTLVLRNDEIIGDIDTFLDFCRDQRLSVLDLPTSFWHFLAEVTLTHDYELPMSLRLIVIGGERARPDLLRRWLMRHPRRPAILNTYGPTETTVVATMWRTDAAFAREKHPAQVPLGRPVSNACVYVLDEHLRLSPIGVPGELFIGGAGLADGYRNRPALTAERFVPNPFVQFDTDDADATDAHRSRYDEDREDQSDPSHPRAIPISVTGQRLYRTGDRVRWLENGNWNFLAAWTIRSRSAATALSPRKWPQCWPNIPPCRNLRCWPRIRARRLLLSLILSPMASRPSPSNCWISCVCACPVICCRRIFTSWTPCPERPAARWM